MNKGFTLMELMIVIVIMGILVAVGLTSYKSTQTKARDIRRKSDLTQIAKALNLYLVDYGLYPLDTNDDIYGCGSASPPNSVCEWGSAFQSTDATGNPKSIYMMKLPADPAGGRWYYYNRFTAPGSPAGSNNAFQLYARLENTLDIDVPHNSTNGRPQNYTGTSCGTGIVCNYAVVSPNVGSESDSHTLADE